MTLTPQRRKVWSIGLGVGLLVLFLGLAALNAFKLSFLSPATPSEIVTFTALSAIAFVLFVAVLLLLGRNLLKLYADQRSRVMGSRLRTRMLWGAVLVSLLPISFMFAFSYLLMNRAVDRWFSQPVTQMRDDASRMALAMQQYTAANARAEAESIAAGLTSTVVAHKAGSVAGGRAALAHVLASHDPTLQGGFALVFRNGLVVGTSNLPQAGNSGVISNASILAQAHRDGQQLLELGDSDYALGLSSIMKQRGSVAEVVVGLPIPHDMSATMTRLRAATNDYWTLMRARRSVRSTYMILLLMMTSLALFASTWLALYLSKQVTKPVEALADAMALIAAGDYAHRVEESATEELGDLVRSFNHMAEDLEGSRGQLSAANAALEARRGELETMLETIPNGVATLDPNRCFLSTNRALNEMLDPGGPRHFVGEALSDVFPAEIVETLDRLFLRSHRMGSASAEMNLGGRDGIVNLLATVALLEADGREHRHLGYVLVLEDATELLRAQKQSAWKEVARRVAHEIKNPLTPISLSAEQIGRHIERLHAMLEDASLDSPSIGVIRCCSQVISSSVESMRGLVDQFASLAQFPTARPRASDLNAIVEGSLALFAGRTQNVRLVQRLGEDLPQVLADPEAMKRALGNVIDNAVEAMQHSLVRELHVSTAVLANGSLELVVADSGTGLTDEMRERLFLPYFSTKQRGTGLGLAIAAKIIQEHGGSIRAEKNDPIGARFIVELRAATVADGVEVESAAHPVV